MKWFIKTKYRKINLASVGNDKDNIIEDLAKYEAQSMHGQLPIIWDKAKNFQVWDIHGNKFIDFTSTIFVANAGHANTHIIRSIKKLLNRPLFHAYTYPTKIRRDYLKKLINTLRDDHHFMWAEKAFLVSSGTEATECAVKLMRLNGRERKKIIAFTGNWHGRTMGAQMLSSNEKQKEWIGYQDPNIIHLPFPYPWSTTEEGAREFFYNSLEQAGIRIEFPTDIAGFVLESYQGWACAFYPKEFVLALSAFAHRHDIPVAWDEIQSGFGRTGKMFGFQWYSYPTDHIQFGGDPKVDLVCCGKGCSSGYPLSMVIGKQRLLDLPTKGSMSSTHSANPIACAAGLANLDIISKPFLDSIVSLGGVFKSRLLSLKNNHPNVIKHVLGNGFVYGVHFKDNTFAKNVAQRCMIYGLIVVDTGRESIKLAPPLTIPAKALLEGLDVFEKVVRELDHE